MSEIAVERLKLEVARLRRERFGAYSERSARIDQLELALEDLEETLAETDAQAAAEPEGWLQLSMRQDQGASRIVIQCMRNGREGASLTYRHTVQFVGARYLDLTYRL